ncbi:hypothetical protein KFE98_21075 [bacterium SCSIO 12741]|nr:hypothetical protein KFE98_21075 [bacterium SCSIO 12741]
MRTTLAYFISIFLFAMAGWHVFQPDQFAPMIPDFIPASVANVAAVMALLPVGFALVWEKYRKWGGIGFSVLMIGFLPIHVWDLFRDDPAIGEPPLPLIRLVFQFLFIYVGWWIYRSSQKS